MVACVGPPGRGRRECRPGVDRRRRRRRRRASSPRCRRSSSHCSETFHPHVAIVLAISPDHLDWHGELRAVRGGEGAHHRRTDVRRPPGFDADDADARAIAEQTHARRAGFSAPRRRHRERARSRRRAAHADGRVWSRSRRCGSAFVHDRTNALASAIAALRSARRPRASRTPLAKYATLLIAWRWWAKLVGAWYDDSKATNPTQPCAPSNRSTRSSCSRRSQQGTRPRCARPRSGASRAVIAFGEAAPEVARRVRRPVPVVTVGRCATPCAPQPAGRSPATPFCSHRVRIVRRVRQLRRTRRRLCRRSPQHHRRRSTLPMTVVTPRLRLPRFRSDSPWPGTRRDPPAPPGAARPASYVVLRDRRRCSTSSAW